MSPFMGLLSLAVLIGVLVFIMGAMLRRKTVMLVSAPAPVVSLLWIVLASWPVNPEKEFSRIFGASNRDIASEIRTSKPTRMDGHFISFRISPTDFEGRIRPQFSGIPLQSPRHFHQGQGMPKEWPELDLEASLILHKEVGNHDVLVIYHAPHRRVYASVRYDQW